MLQHIDPKLVRGYLKEFVRILKPGGVAVFQLPDYARSLREKLAIRTRLNRALGMEVRTQHVYNNMEMNWMGESEVRSILKRAGDWITIVLTTSEKAIWAYNACRFRDQKGNSGLNV